MRENRERERAASRWIVPMFLSEKLSQTLNARKASHVPPLTFDIKSIFQYLIFDDKIGIIFFILEYRENIDFDLESL